MFGSDKLYVLFVASYAVPENNSLYDTLEMKNGILILEESILKATQNEDLYMLICGDLNARTGCEKPTSEEMLNNLPGPGDNDDADRVIGHSKDKIVNNFGKSWCIYAGLCYRKCVL